MGIISIKNISKTYPGKTPITALDDISLDIQKGELFGLIGPDGAGKTSLFRILTTLISPDKGSASVDTFDVITQFREIRSTVGYMPGRFSLYQDLTTEENLTFFADAFNCSLEENYDLIKDIYIQIEPFRKRKAGKLSGGMKQKLALCCALIHRPAILFLDEPTTGVDPVSRKEFWDMLKHLKEQKITTMISTPYMDEACLCDRIALIQSGKILSVNTPTQIIEKYPHRLYAVKSENNYLLLERLKKQKEITSCYIFGEYLHVTFSGDEVEIPNAEVVEIKPGIEDCFIQLMTKNESDNN
ncbi:MAG: ABC transporter ATP-binding protein [Flavobacteriaceae bacterium]|jgi:ABC-type multidrug transport system ATPase subunit|nr:ABC transporter ATP-binding protein [Flavobacteriaceae bacterium]